MAIVGIGGLAVISALSVSAVLAAGARFDRDDLAATAGYLQSRVGPGDAAISLLGNETHRFLNAWKLPLEHVGLPVAPVAAGSRTEQALIRVTERPRTVWLVMQGLDRADARDGVERWLVERGYRGEQQWVGGTRIVPIRTELDADDVLPAPEPFAAARLDAVRVSRSVRAGDDLAVETAWTAAGPATSPLRIFVNLVALDGAGLVTSIAEPLDGFAGATTWTAGQHFRDGRLLEVPTGAAPAVYRLEVGLFDPATQRRLPLVGGASQLAVVAGHVAVRPASLSWFRRMPSERR
jgi:hypothetical protein